MAGELSRRTSLSQRAHVADKLFHGDVRTQFAAICYRQNNSDGSIEVLLITSRDSGRWVIPKGWPMRKKKPHEVARQEAWEEAGVRGRVLKKAWGHYTYMKKLDDGELVPAVVQVHLLDVAQMEDDFPERHQRRLAWFMPSIAASAVEEPELSGLLTKLELLNSDERRLCRVPEPSR
ncbi:NUDIX hydrolase [Agrobacterium vaccinii]|uniref:NUDIX hydrolase n=1 Tax=Agrobacterium vaccinii TaxID=2735528 RepID=UPI001E3739C1|nr:NUDIX hydrolase [Agrobacterium vaccinii]UHS59832.1 NUDIX hydrolase [Agrobacterium vaccinii]